MITRSVEHLSVGSIQHLTTFFRLLQECQVQTKNWAHSILSTTQKAFQQSGNIVQTLQGQIRMPRCVCQAAIKGLRSSSYLMIISPTSPLQKFWPIWNRSCDWIQDWWNVLKLNSRDSPVSRHRLQLASTSDRLDIVLCAIGTQTVWPTPAPMMENMHHR